MVRRWFFALSALALIAVGLASLWWPGAAWSLLFIGPLILLGIRDSLQRKHTVLRNFPVIGHGRYFMEMVRPEIQQYFIESNIDAFPIEREMRSVVYRRAKGDLDTTPFGTQRNVYRIGYEWAGHSIAARRPPQHTPRVSVGGPDCQQPYSASLLNVSALSFGALSSNAVRALNRGARLADIYAVDYVEIRLPIPDADLAFIDLPLDHRDVKRTGGGPVVTLRVSQLLPA